jgi:hypothetical protein
MRLLSFVLLIISISILFSCRRNQTDNNNQEALSSENLSIDKDSLLLLFRHSSNVSGNSDLSDSCDCNINAFFEIAGEGSYIDVNFRDKQEGYLNLSVYKGHITAFDGNMKFRFDVVYSYSNQPIYLKEKSWTSGAFIRVHTKKDTATLYALPDKQSHILIRFGEEYNIHLIGCKRSWLELEVWINQKKYTGWMENKFVNFEYSLL